MVPRQWFTIWHSTKDSSFMAVFPNPLVVLYVGPRKNPRSTGLFPNSKMSCRLDLPNVGRLFSKSGWIFCEAPINWWQFFHIF